MLKCVNPLIMWYVITRPYKFYTQATTTVAGDIAFICSAPNYYGKQYCFVICEINKSCIPGLIFGNSYSPRKPEFPVTVYEFVIS